MKVVMFILAALLGITWIFNIISSHIGSGLQAIVAFIGMGVCLGLGGILGRLETRPQTP